LLINVFVVFPSGKNLLYQLFRTAEAGEPHLPVAIGKLEWKRSHPPRRKLPPLCSDRPPRKMLSGRMFVASNPARAGSQPVPPENILIESVRTAGTMPSGCPKTGIDVARRLCGVRLRMRRNPAVTLDKAPHDLTHRYKEDRDMKERYVEECQIEQGARSRSSSSSDVLPTKRPESGLYDSAQPLSIFFSSPLPPDDFRPLRLAFTSGTVHPHID
jgi:hypothetical protein